MKNPFQQRINFTERFKKRHSLRFHMTLILLMTICSGFLATRILLAFHLKNVVLRYPLAVVFAYLVFFISIKLWLKYIAPSPIPQKTHSKSSDVLGVLPDIPISGSSGGSSSVGEIFSGGGGGFGGGGATGGFDEISSALTDGGSGVLSFRWCRCCGQ